MDWIVARTHGFELNVTALLISFLTEYRNTLPRGSVWTVAYAGRTNSGLLRPTNYRTIELLV